jgi:hypothetical protein
MRETISFSKVRNHVPDDEEHIAEERNFRWHFESSKNKATLGNIQKNLKKILINRV